MLYVPEDNPNSEICREGQTLGHSPGNFCDWPKGTLPELGDWVPLIPTVNKGPGYWLSTFITPNMLRDLGVGIPRVTVGTEFPGQRCKVVKRSNA
jgi:hypothetical protein